MVESTCRGRCIRTSIKYKDLIVRVAVYSDYFVDLGIDLQNEIIKRTEHLNY